MRIGHPLIHLPTTTSTTDDVARFAAYGAEEGLVVVADKQTAGRGRAGRSWHSPIGSGLYCSVLLRPQISPSCLSTLPLVAGVAVAEAIEELAPVRCQLKWPNDVWLEGQKVAGLLMTAKSAFDTVDDVILGVGINLSGGTRIIPVGATSIFASSGVSTTPSLMLQVVIDKLQRRYDDFLLSHGRPGLTPWLERAALIGEFVSVIDARDTVSGVMRGVNEFGALLLETNGELRRVVAGDLTRGPQRKLPGRDPLPYTAALATECRRGAPTGPLPYGEAREGQ